MASEQVVEVDTETAAHVVGKTVVGFRRWAARRGLEPVRVEQLRGRAGHGGRRRVALWDLEAIHRETDTHG